MIPQAIVCQPLLVWGYESSGEQTGKVPLAALLLRASIAGGFSSENDQRVQFAWLQSNLETFVDKWLDLTANPVAGPSFCFQGQVLVPRLTLARHRFLHYLHRAQACCSARHVWEDAQCKLVHLLVFGI